MTPSIQRKPKTRTPGVLTLEGLVTKIRKDVQAFASSLVGIQRETETLAPLVAEAFTLFKAANADATKLNFIRLFATKEQLLNFPDTDMAAKMPGSPVQALFNSIEYLMRRATQLKNTEADAVKLETTVAEVGKTAAVEAASKGLKGDEADIYVRSAQQDVIEASGHKPRTSIDDIANVIHDGWYSDLAEAEVFFMFCVKILMLKFSQNTANSIIEKARGLIVATQAAQAPPIPPTPAPALVQQVRKYPSAA